MELIDIAAKLTHAELMAVLSDLRDGAAEGDTLEGFVEFTVAEENDRWNVRARYRINNAA